MGWDNTGLWVLPLTLEEQRAERELEREREREELEAAIAAPVRRNWSFHTRGHWHVLRLSEWEWRR